MSGFGPGIEANDDIDAPMNLGLGS